MRDLRVRAFQQGMEGCPKWKLPNSRLSEQFAVLTYLQVLWWRTYDPEHSRRHDLSIIFTYRNVA